MTGRLPNFLYVGPDKAGSTWLHEVLVSHPEIYLTPAKDLYFFDRYFSRGTEWYRRQFAEASDEPIVGEICQDYLSHPEAPERIRSTLGAPRMMVTLRDPVQRAFSSYLYMRKHGEKPGTFGEALRTRPELLDHGRYGSQLRRYVDLFGSDAFHVAVFDDLQADPQKFLNEVLDWLGVGPLRLRDEDRESKLPASRARFVPAAWLVRQAANVVRELNGAELVGKVKRSAAVHSVLYTPLSEEARQVDPQDAAWVKHRLRPEVERLEQDFGLDLITRWGW